jgi:hypothetical protein
LSERISFVISPSGGPYHDLLTIHDAMQQVLDLVGLLSDDQSGVVWALAYAATNSPPFTVQAEAVSLRPGIDITLPAKSQKRSFYANLEEIKVGKLPEEWSSGNKRTHVTSLLTRNQNGIGRTEVALDAETAPVVFDKAIAEKAIEQLSPPSDLSAPQRHTEIGTLEGVLVDITTYYDGPAIKVRDRRARRDIPCLITTDIRDSIASVTNSKTVWNHGRVRVHGRISYDDQGKIVNVEADDVTLLETSRKISYQELHDRDFTGGKSVADYLDDVREGRIGD